MAATECTYGARQNALLASVFPSRILPPRNQQRFRADSSKIGDEAHKKITEDARLVLGIGNEKYAYHIQGCRHAYWTNFTKCPSISQIAQPSEKDHAAFMQRMSKILSIAKVPTWSQQLGVDRLKKMFATVIDKAMTDFIQCTYAGIYNNEVQEHLQFWIEHVFAIYIKFFRATIDNRTGSNASFEASAGELRNFHYKALTRLASLRIDELFDIIVDWDNTVAGIDDIRPFITGPNSRTYLTSKFANVLQTRLLHPGASTVEILQIYISMIRAFRRLDPRGVLLERVARKTRRYLRERDDTVKVVVAGLLSDVSNHTANPTPEQQDPEILTELAWELQHRETRSNTDTSSSGLDWNNMDWLPDPIDAAPDYIKSSKNTDVIGSVISLFESKEIFVKELQLTLAERLLRNKNDYDQEISVIEHLKIRFGDSALQACEVMLRDVLDSRRLDAVIRKDQNLDILNELTEPSLHAKILSRLFWPSLPGAIPISHDEDDDTPQFKPPLPIMHQRSLYEKGFESLKQTRKLTWNDNLGQVEIELTFADGRSYHDEVLPYQAAVIYSFNDDADVAASSSSSRTTGKARHEGITKTISEISTDLNLPPTLTRSACLLFISKRVLTSHATIPDAFTVLEYLPSDTATSTNTTATAAQHPNSPSHHESQPHDTLAAQTEAASARQAELAAQQAMKAAEAADRKQKLAIYHQFIISMLTNQGAMPLPRIAMMLGIVVPGGFPFSNEELKEMLSGMVRDGEIGFDAGGGGKYKKV